MVYIYNLDNLVYVARWVVWLPPRKVVSPRLIDFSKLCPVSYWSRRYSCLGLSSESRNVFHDSIPWSCSSAAECDLGLDALTYLGCGPRNFKRTFFWMSFTFSCKSSFALAKKEDVWANFVGCRMCISVMFNYSIPTSFPSSLLAFYSVWVFSMVMTRQIVDSPTKVTFVRILQSLRSSGSMVHFSSPMSWNSSCVLQYLVRKRINCPWTLHTPSLLIETSWTTASYPFASLRVVDLLALKCFQTRFELTSAQLPFSIRGNLISFIISRISSLQISSALLKCLSDVQGQHESECEQSTAEVPFKKWPIFSNMTLFS